MEPDIQKDKNWEIFLIQILVLYYINLHFNICFYKITSIYSNENELHLKYILSIFCIFERKWSFYDG